MHRAPRTTPSVLDRYLREISRIPLLTPDEEQRLARDLRDHVDTRAAHRLVEANLRFVVKIAFEHRSYGIPLTDLIQEGNLGLMRGVQKFDPDRKIRLISYAIWWIRAYIQGHVLKSWSLVKLGTTQTQRKLFFSLARTRREIERLSPGAGPEYEQTRVDLVAKKLEVKASDVIEMQQRLAARDFSLEAPIGDGTATHLDSIVSAGPSQDEELARCEEDAILARRVGDAIRRLDPRERHIIETRVMGDGKETLRDMGEHFGFSRERARQLQIRGLEKLRRELRPFGAAVERPVSPGDTLDR